MSTLEERVAALERQVREQSSLRAAQDVLAEHTATLADHSRQFESLHGKLDLLVAMLSSIAGRDEAGDSEKFDTDVEGKTNGRE